MIRIRDMLAGYLMIATTTCAFGATPPVTIARTPTGAIFITAEGKSLYGRVGDGCRDRCLLDWVPLSAQAIDAGPPGWSVIRRKDGGHQWAYRGQPLYTCRKDGAPGQVTCNGLGNGAFQVARP